MLRQNWRGATEDVSTPTRQPSPGRYPWQWYWDSCFAAIVWRRFEPARARPELESLLAAQRPDGFIGHTIFWDRPVSLVRLALLQRRLAQLASRPGRSSRRCWPGPGRSPSATRPRSRGSAAQGLAGGQSRPRGRRAALDRATRRVRARRLAQVRTGLGAALERARSASRCWSSATAGSGFDARRVRTAAARSSARPWSTRSGRSRCRRWAGPRRRRRWSSGSGTSGAASSSTRHSRAALGPSRSPGPHSPRSPCPTCRGDRPPPGRGAPARRGRVPHPGRAALGRRRRAELRARWQPRPAASLLARADLGQLRLAGSGWACAGSATRTRPGTWPSGVIGAVEREGLREYYDPRTGAGLGARDFAWSALIAELANPDEGAKTSYL